MNTILTRKQFENMQRKYRQLSSRERQDFLNELTRRGRGPFPSLSEFDANVFADDAYAQHVAQGVDPDVVDKYFGVELRTYAQLAHEAQKILIPHPQDYREKLTALYLPDEPPLEVWDFPRGPWRPRDVADMRRLMAHHYTTAQGLVGFYEGTVVREDGVDRGLDPDSLRANLLQRAGGWIDPRFMMVHADEAFATMARAAASTAPETKFSLDELLSPVGAVFFRNEVRIEEVHPDLKLRTLYWRVLETHEGEPYIQVDLLQDGPMADPDPSVLANPRMLESVYYLRTMGSMTLPVDDPGPHDHFITQTLAFFRAMNAVARSPRTRSEDVVTGRARGKKKKHRRAEPASQQTVRTLSLREPEHARHEMDAATGAAPRVGVRQHWVRGHWRSQWYPSLDDHRSIWIDGFIKGDAGLGVMPTTVVHTVRG